MRRVYSFYEGGGAPSSSHSGYGSRCSHCESRRDCDGDYVHICTYGGYCPSKSVRRDCDGDRIQICLS